MSEPLFAKLAQKVDAWRADGYRCDYPLIGEILRYQIIGESPADLRYLRAAQFRALETYWWLRLKKNTPHIMKLYQAMYPCPPDFARALGFELSADDMVDDNTVDGVVAKIKNPEWAAAKRMDAAHESATLLYPSYILALAMGAGKTVLIGAIIATEFAMSLRYSENKNSVRFMQNALVFAPGLTIIESLREISDIPMEQILPSAALDDYNANVKIIYARKAEKEIAAIPQSRHNIIVSNSQKINLRAAPRKANQRSLMKYEEAALTANLRLQKIISLPNLGVFSDEAHHTYGNRAAETLKRARETVNYINQKTPLVAVVNTTGTPYSRGKILSEVICWYGLADGIKDRVLKNLENGVYAYDMKGDNAEEKTIDHVVKEFFGKYKNTRLQNGARAKIAFYFNTQAHLDESRPLLEKAMRKIGESATQILVNTQQSAKEEVDDFNRLNDPGNQKRVILLVQKGVEGWNCPSLFACALIKEQTNEIFVLQAATRCLRQTPENTQSASVFLSPVNRKKLEKALKANFDTTLYRLNWLTTEDIAPVMVKICKPDLPKLEITRTVKRIAKRNRAQKEVVLTKPKAAKTPDRITVEIGTPDFDGWRILRPGITRTVESPANVLDNYAAASRIAANYHLPVLPMLRQLQKLYPGGDIPAAHFADLLRQVESQTADYFESREKIKEVLALIRTLDKHGKPVFATDKDGCLVHRLLFAKGTLDRMRKNGLIVSADGANETVQTADARDISYHYTPYCLDSAPEGDFFRRILAELDEDPDDIRAFLFTGHASARMTDFYFHYEGADGKYHAYFPDFILLKNNGDFYVVEIKAEKDRHNPDVQNKEKAVQSLAAMPENRFRYVVIYTDDAQIAPGDDDFSRVRGWIREDGFGV